MTNSVSGKMSKKLHKNQSLAKSPKSEKFTFRVKTGPSHVHDVFVCRPNFTLSLASRVLRASSLRGKGREQGHDWPYCLVSARRIVFPFIFLFDVSIITRRSRSTQHTKRALASPGRRFYFFLRASAE